MQLTVTGKQIDTGAVLRQHVQARRIRPPGQADEHISDLFSFVFIAYEPQLIKFLLSYAMLHALTSAILFFLHFFLGTR
jgi:hypothetical protein